MIPDVIQNSKIHRFRENVAYKVKLKGAYCELISKLCFISLTLGYQEVKHVYYHFGIKMMIFGSFADPSVTTFIRE